eukprot:6182963-Pleurochrysis_carterae.AAC.3
MCANLFWTQDFKKVGCSADFDAQARHAVLKTKLSRSSSWRCLVFDDGRMSLFLTRMPACDMARIVRKVDDQYKFKGSERVRR